MPSIPLYQYHQAREVLREKQSENIKTLKKHKETRKMWRDRLKRAKNTRRKSV